MKSELVNCIYQHQFSFVIAKQLTENRNKDLNNIKSLEHICENKEIKIKVNYNEEKGIQISGCMSFHDFIVFQQEIVDVIFKPLGDAQLFFIGNILEYKNAWNKIKDRFPDESGFYWLYPLNNKVEFAGIDLDNKKQVKEFFKKKGITHWKKHSKNDEEPNPPSKCIHVKIKSKKPYKKHLLHCGHSYITIKCVEQ